jgi:hypothetical protein
VGPGDSAGGPLSGAQLAQAILLGLPPSIFFARPPAFVPPPPNYTPLEELPAGSAGGDLAGKSFRPVPDDYPEGTPCTYCRQPTTREPGRPNSLERDHNIPASRGGNATPENRLPACRTCNRQKGARTPSEWYAAIRKRLGL